MRFIPTQKTPNLKVVLRSRRTTRDPVTNEIFEVQPSLVVQFSNMLYTTRTEEEAVEMLKKLDFCKMKGIPAQFRIHPEDVAEAEALRAAIQEEASEGVVRAVRPRAESAPAALPTETVTQLIQVVSGLAEQMQSIQAQVAALQGKGETKPKTRAKAAAKEDEKPGEPTS